MVAVVEHVAGLARTLPLVDHANGNRIVAWRDGRPVTIAAFLADVDAIAAVLPNAAAVNLCEDRYMFLAAFCAVACRGQTNLLPPSRAPRAIDEALAAYPGSVAIGDVALTPTPTDFIGLPALASYGSGRSRSIAGDAVVAIGFTSGSTGQPKANAKTWASFHASSAQNSAALTAALGLRIDEIAHIVATVPPQHMYGIEMSVLLPLLGPFSVHGGRPLFPADVAAALDEIPEPRVLVTTPVHLRALLRDPVALPRIAAITSATASLPVELARAAEARYGAPVLELFGSTETCVIAERRTALGDEWQLYPQVTLRPQPDGTVVDAPYFAAPMLLQDVVELMPGRQFRLRGRHADLVEIAGKRASLADLTRKLLALPGVLDAIVLQLDDADAFGVRRIAALAVAPGHTESELQDAFRLEVDPAFLPRPLRVVTSLPRNEVGKLPRTAVMAALESRCT